MIISKAASTASIASTVRGEHYLMRQDIFLCPWAAAALLLLLTTSPNLSMAFSAQHMHNSLRSSSHARLFQNAHFSRGLCCAAHDSIPRRKGVRRTRESMLQSERQGISSPSASRVQQSSPLRTAIDRALPFGRCVGVELPVALTAEAVRTAKEELMPEEMSYGLGLPPSLQVSDMALPLVQFILYSRCLVLVRQSRSGDNRQNGCGNKTWENSQQDSQGTTIAVL